MTAASPTAASTAAAASAPRTLAEPRLDKKRFFAFLCMVFGMFMAILDIQVVSASLSEIQSGISASADEIPWVQTSYLIAEVIMIPLSGFLSRVVSTRWMFVVSAGGFTFMSFLCAQATSIEEMIVFRALQGFIGGGMIPTVFASAYTIFPRSKMALVTPMIGLVATLAPTIGPTVGGYLTNMLSWHWLFLINVGPGILVTIATFFLVDFDEPDWSLLDRFDWVGLAAMAGFLGGMEYVLEEGPQKDWFGSDIVFWATVLSSGCGCLFFWRAFTAKQPIVDLGAFRDRNFWTGSLFSFVMGIGLYGLTYVYPVFLGRVRGYSAEQIGETMFLTGVCMFFTAPIAGRLIGKVDPRLLIATGFGLFGLGAWIASGLTKEWGFDELLWPQIFRGVGLMLAMIPINNTALGTLPPQRMKNASGLFNLTRNLGGAVGLAIINTLINKREDLHLARLHERIAWGRNVADETLANMTRSMAQLGSDAELAATKQLAALARRDALVMSLADVFVALTVLFVALVLLVPLMRRPVPMASSGGH